MRQIAWILDTTEAEVRFGLFENGNLLDHVSWLAGRELTSTFFTQFEKLLAKNSLQFSNIKEIIAVIGPGSFTGLRIGIVIANAFSYAQSIPIIGVIKDKNLSLEEIFRRGGTQKPQGLLAPYYDREPNITKRRKR